MILLEIFLIRKLKQKKKCIKATFVQPFFFHLCDWDDSLYPSITTRSIRKYDSRGTIKAEWISILIWLGFQNLPQISLVILGVGMILSFLFILFETKGFVSSISKSDSFPIVGQSVQQYVTFLYAREIFLFFLGMGNLF